MSREKLVEAHIHEIGTTKPTRVALLGMNGRIGESKCIRGGVIHALTIHNHQIAFSNVVGPVREGLDSMGGRRHSYSG